MLYTFLKKNRSHLLIAPLINLRVPLQRFLERLFGADHFSYWCYEVYCRFFASPKSRILSDQNIRVFHKHKILIVPNFINEETISSISNSMDLNLNDQNIRREDSLYSNNNPNFFQRLYDRFINNVVIYYNYPVSYLSEVDMIIDPLKNIDKIGKTIANTLVPAINDLMGSHTEVVRAWAYRTINLEGKETHNRQNHWHMDGDASSAIKCIVYLTDVTDQNGPFIYHDKIKNEHLPAIGKKGTAVFFRSALLRHRGSNTLSAERKVFSFLSYPCTQNIMPKDEVPTDFIRRTFPFFSKYKNRK
jgi:hypothetical protein